MNYYCDECYSMGIPHLETQREMLRKEILVERRQEEQEENRGSGNYYNGSPMPAIRYPYAKWGSGGGQGG